METLMIRTPRIPPVENESLEKRAAFISMRINKYLLWIPVLPALLFSPSIITYLRMAGINNTFPANLLMFGLLSYPVVYAVSFALAPRYEEKGQFSLSIAISFSPFLSVLMAATGYLVIFF
jgi:hypothetical protein